MSEMSVQTQYGMVQGVREGTISSWKGIPYAQPPLGVRIENPLRQSGRLAAEHQHVGRFVARLRVRRLGGLREEPGFARREPPQQRRPIVHDFPQQMPPIVEAGAAQVIVVGPKA